MLVHHDIMLGCSSSTSSSSSKATFDNNSVGRRRGMVVMVVAIVGAGWRWWWWASEMRNLFFLGHDLLVESDDVLWKDLHLLFIVPSRWLELVLLRFQQAFSLFEACTELVPLGHRQLEALDCLCILCVYLHCLEVCLFNLLFYVMKIYLIN